MPADAVELPLSGPQALLVHQALNEVLHGIQGIHIFSQVGISKLALGEIFVSFDTWLRAQEVSEDGSPAATFKRSFCVGEVRALRNAIEIVMLELGQEEFFTRTGFSLAEAASLLDRFNSALLHPLHIDQRTQPIAR